MSNFDVCVLGQGVVGRALALSLGAQGWRVASVRAPASHGGSDIRAYALNAASVALLRQLKIWPALETAHATRVTRMQIYGDGDGQLEFSAWQQHTTDLSWIVDAAALERLLGEAMRYANSVEEVSQEVPAALLAVCEGTHSSTRERLGIGYQRHRYEHRAVATRLACEQPHRGVAWQWFRSPDVLALLPFDAPQRGHSYALVWSLPQERAQALADLSDEAFLDTLNATLLAAAHEDGLSQVGRMVATGERASWPLSLAGADAWCGAGWVLLGDAAHQVHPLSGQGLNLGLGDVRALGEVLQQLRLAEPWRGPGDEAVLRRYERARALPTRMMSGLTDGLLNLFAAPSPWAAQVRNLGMSWIDRWTPAKRWLAQRAMDESA